MRKLILPLGIIAALAVAVVVLLLSPRPKYRIVSVVTFVDHPVLNTIEKSFRDKLLELTGTGQKVRIVTSNAQGRVEQLPELARQVLQGTPDVILAISTPVSQAVLRAVNGEQPVVYTFVTNPADLGDELTRTNSTGLSDAVNYAGNLDLIREVFGPNVTIGMLYNPSEANSQFGHNLVQEQLKGTGARLVSATVTKEADIPSTTAQLAQAVDVIYVGGDNTVVGAMPAVLAEAARRKVPVFASDIGSVEAGAIAGLSVDYAQLGVQTAEVVKKVLDGTAPRDIARMTLPGNQLVVNLSAAERLGFIIPAAVLARADVKFEE